MESFEDCAIRETREEAGIEIKNIQFLCIASVKKYAPKHYVHITMTANWASGRPTVMESEKAEGWDWYDTNNLPNGAIFELSQLSFDAYKNNIQYYKNF